MADAAGLANDQVRRCQIGIQDVVAVFLPAIVVCKPASHTLNEIAVAGHITAAPAHTQHRFLMQIKGDGDRTTGGRFFKGHVGLTC